MNKLILRAAPLLVAAAALASCSRSQYAFQTDSAAYHSATINGPAPVSEATLAQDTPAAAAPAEPELLASAAPVDAAPGPRRPASQPLPRPAAASTATAPAQEPAARKALRREARLALKPVRPAAEAKPKPKASEGKSQLTALLLAVFLSPFGVHRFYLGYTGRGILYLALFLTSWLIVPLIVLGVLTTIDLVQIITGELTPRGAEYAKTLGEENKDKPAEKADKEY